MFIMAHKKTPKLLTKLTIVSAVTATLPLATSTNIHANEIGVQQAMTTTIRQTADRTNNTVKKNNKQSHATPEPADTESYGIYVENDKDSSSAIDPFSFFVFGIGAASLITLIILAIETIRETFDKKSNQAPTEGRRNSYEAR